MACDGDVPHPRHAEQGFDLRSSRHWLERGPEKDEKINLAIDNRGADLLIAPQRSTLEFGNFETQFLFQYPTGCAGGIDLVVSQERSIIFGPFNQILLLIVVRNKG